MSRMVLLGALLSGCAIFNAPPDSYSDTAEPGSETEGPETMPVSDDSGDTQTGDSGTGDGFDCEQSVKPVAAQGDCVKREITCGETFVDTTTLGTAVMGEDEYASWYCVVFPDGDYSGNERIYYFTHPGTGNVTIELDSPCADLDLFAFQWEYWSTDLTCPTASHAVGSCEEAKGSGGGSVTIYDSSESHYMIIVDGPKPVEDIFELSVTCP